MQGSEPDGLFSGWGKVGERSKRASRAEKARFFGAFRATSLAVFWAFFEAFYPPLFHHGVGLKIQDIFFTRRVRLIRSRTNSRFSSLANGSNRAFGSLFFEMGTSGASRAQNAPNGLIFEILPIRKKPDKKDH